MQAKYESFMNKYRVADKTESTHTTFGGGFDGKYNIPNDKLKDLYAIIVLNAKSNRKHFSVIEKVPKNGIKPFLIDLDLKYKEEINIDDDMTIQDLCSFCERLAQIIIKITDFTEDSIYFIIQSRDSGYFDTDNHYKCGYHVILPYLILSIDDQHIIRYEMLKEMTDLFKRNMNKSEDIFDKSVIGVNGSYIYGCGKSDQSSPYKNRYELEFNVSNNKYELSLVDADEISVEIIDTFSQRQDVSEYKQYKVKAEYIPKIEPKKTPKISLIKKSILSNKIKYLSNQESAEYIYLLQNIDQERFNNYHDWFKILIILKTANIDFEVFNEFSSRSDKYKGHADCLKYWDNFNIKDISKPLTISSLYEYLKHDNYELYEELLAKVREVCANQVQIEIAELYYIFIENNKKLNRYIYSEQEQTWYYCNESNIWSCSQSVDYPLSLKDDIYKVLKPVFERKASQIIEQIAEKEQEKIPFLTSDNADQAKYNKTELSNINKEIADLNNYKKRAMEISKMTGHDTKGRNIMAFLKSKFSKKICLYTSFNLKHIFACNNVLIDFTPTADGIVGIRPIQPEDMVMNTTGYDWCFEDLVEEKRELDKFFSSIFINNNVKNFHLLCMARALYGDIEGAQYFYINTGTAANGKGINSKIFATMFGAYGTSISLEAICNKKSNPEAPNPVLLSIAGKRYVSVHETDQDSEINAPMIKGITGNDVQIGRAMYGKEIIKFMPQCHLELNCNHLPKFKDTSNAMARRNIVMHYPFTFADVEEETEYIKKCDSNLLSKLTNGQMPAAMLQILYEIFLNNFIESKKITNIPIEVKNTTNDYNIDNDPITKWITTYYTIDESAKPIKPSELYEQYKIDTHSTESQTRFGLNMKAKFQNLIKEIRKVKYYVNLKRKTTEEEQIQEIITDAMLSNKSEI